MESVKKQDSSFTPKYMWELEYLHQGIPSSFRTGPSGVVQDFLVYVRKSGLQNGYALDLGCGKGRNSFFLARHGFQVSCIDFVQGNIDLIRSVCAVNSLPIHATCDDITDGLPYPNQFFDVAIDVFCYKHQVDPESRRRYRSELGRVVKPSGFVLLSLAGADDGFYGPLLASSPDPRSRVVVDPYSGLASVLFSEKALAEELSDTFMLVELWNKRKEGLMHGKCYVRSTIVAILQRLF